MMLKNKNDEYKRMENGKTNSIRVTTFCSVQTVCVCVQSPVLLGLLPGPVYFPGLTQENEPLQLVLEHFQKFARATSVLEKLISA